MTTPTNNVVRLPARRETEQQETRRDTRVKLTTQKIDAAQPAIATDADGNPKLDKEGNPIRKRTLIADAHVIGLYLNVQPTGTKSFIVRGRVDGGRARPLLDVKIGGVGTISLADARKEAKTVLAQMRAGIDPRRNKELDLSTGDLVERYIAHQQTRGIKRLDNIRRSLYRATKGFKREPFDTVERSRWSAALAKTHKSPGYAAMREDLKWVKAMTSWAVDQQLVRNTDAMLLKAPPRSQEETIAKAEAEASRWTLRQKDWPAFWQATEVARSPHFRDYLRCLALTGLRRGEAALARWEDIDLETRVWRIPPANTKNGREHQVFFGPMIADILAETPRVAGSDLVFPGRGNVVMSGWSKLVKPVSEALGTKVQLHGLRRGYRTALSELRIDPDLREMMVAHSAPDLVRRYDLSELEEQRRDAQAELEAAWMEALA